MECTTGIYLQGEERMPGFKRRILIVEDDVFLGSLMVDALSNKGFVAQLAETAVSAKRSVKSFDPDIVLADIDLGDEVAPRVEAIRRYITISGVPERV